MRRDAEGKGLAVGTQRVVQVIKRERLHRTLGIELDAHIGGVYRSLTTPQHLVIIADNLNSLQLQVGLLGRECHFEADNHQRVVHREGLRVVVPLTDQQRQVQLIAKTWGLLAQRHNNLSLALLATRHIRQLRLEVWVHGVGLQALDDGTALRSVEVARRPFERGALDRRLKLGNRALVGEHQHIVANLPRWLVLTRNIGTREFRSGNYRREAGNALTTRRRRGIGSLFRRLLAAACP